MPCCLCLKCRAVSASACAKILFVRNKLLCRWSMPPKLLRSHITVLLSVRNEVLGKGWPSALRPNAVYKHYRKLRNVINSKNSDPIGFQCSKDLGIAYDKPNPPMLLICNEQSVESLTFLEPQFILFYVYISMQLFLLILYHCYRILSNKSSKSDSYTFFEDSSATPLDKISFGASKKNSDLKFSGYRKDFFGRLVKYSLVLTSVLFFAIFVILILDYYQVFTGSMMLVFIDHKNLSKVMFLFTS